MSPILKNLARVAAAFIALLLATRFVADRWEVSVVTATAKLDRGTVIEARDVKLQTTNRQKAKGVATETGDVVGREVTAPVAAGEPIKRGVIKEASLAPSTGHRAFPLRLDSSKVVTAEGLSEGDRVDISFSRGNAPPDMVVGIRVLAVDENDNTVLLELDNTATLAIQRSVGRWPLTITKAAM